MDEAQIIEIIEPTRFAKFNTIESYNTVNRSIAQWKDQQTNGEYSRTNTEYEYNPEPEANWDECYYMEALPEYINAGVFEGVDLLDSIPIEETPQEELP